MRKFIAASIVALVVGLQSAEAANYVAICDDGQGVQYNIYEKQGQGILYMKPRDSVYGGMVQIATFKMVYNNGYQICGVAVGGINPVPASFALCVQYLEFAPPGNAGNIAGTSIFIGDHSVDQIYNFHGQFCHAHVKIS